MDDRKLYGENSMSDREFEEFILLQVRRSHSIYAISRWVYLLLAIAAGVMFIAGMWMGLDLFGGLVILIMGLGFLPASFYAKATAASFAEAADEIAYGLEHPETGDIEYSDLTKKVRQSACRSLKSTKGLIASYGIIGLMCWVGGVIIVIASEPGTSGFSPGIFALSIVMFAMAVFLTVLTIKSIRDLPMAERYRQLLAEGAGPDPEKPAEGAGPDPAKTAEDPDAGDAK